MKLNLKKGEDMNSLEYLKSKQIQFREIVLSEIPKSSEDVVRIYGCPLEQVLKTLVFVGSEVIIIVLQGNKKVNIEKLRLIVNDRKIRMATPEEIKKLFNKNIGSLDPFINSEGCIKILDKGIFNMDMVNMGAGVPGIGIEMTIKELKKAWDGLIEDISQ
jgi:prolyl-tRNA editing enzyme YbaK/EbsC (Cys-tRNA(Pro) deacylase)